MQILRVFNDLTTILPLNVIQKLTIFIVFFSVKITDTVYILVEDQIKSHFAYHVLKQTKSLAVYSKI